MSASALRIAALTLVALTTLSFFPPRPATAETLPRSIADRDYYDDGAPSPDKVELGKLLFYDKVLSGNLNISCATCHHHLTGTGDGLALPVGEGGFGLGVARHTGLGDDAVHERVPRNAPHIFNVGAREYVRMFHDGRVEVDPASPSGFRTPAGDDLPSGLDNVLAAQAMFPVTSGTEMAGQPGENPIADSGGAGNLAGDGGVWPLLADRLRNLPGYVALFEAAFDDVDGAADITYVHAANAIAAFEAVAGRADQSPFDRFLRGEPGTMSPEQLAGMELFYGPARCATCHSGPFQTDQDFHDIAMVQVGPGKGDGFDGHEDFGRERVTHQAVDRRRFRTPSLRNIALTAPFGHDGAYDTLRAVIEHHVDPEGSVIDYDRSQLAVPSRADLDPIDFAVMDDPTRRAELVASHELPGISLGPRQLRLIEAFLHSLTDPRHLDMRRSIPRAVPSGLPVAD